MILLEHLQPAIEFDQKMKSDSKLFTKDCTKHKRLTKQTGNDFRKDMYSIHTGPDAMSAPVRTSVETSVNIKNKDVNF